MISHKYGEFSAEQVESVKQFLRKRIFFLLIVAEDPASFRNVDLAKAHINVMWRISGLNSLLGEPREVVNVLSLLEEAYNTLITDPFNFQKYRKLILDAGSEIMKSEV